MKIRSWRYWFDLAKAAVKGWSDDYASSMGAALAYYTVFSMAPLLIIAIAVAALVFGEQAAHDAIVGQLRALLGEDGTKGVQMLLSNAKRPEEGAISTAIGFVMLLIGATTVFAELESDLNRIFKAKAPTGSGIWHFIHTRLLSIGMVMAIGFLLLVSLIISAALSAWGKYWGGLFGDMEALLHAVNFVVSMAVVTVLFALMYKILPSVRIPWRDVWMGAFITALLFSLGKFLIGLYIGKTGVASSYGAAGTLVVLLVWVYYSAQIFLFGAEFTKAYASSRGTLPETEKAAEANPALGSLRPG